MKDSRKVGIVGIIVGDLDDTFVGKYVGVIDGVSVTVSVGNSDGISVGWPIGFSDGLSVVTGTVGSFEGRFVGFDVRKLGIVVAGEDVPISATMASSTVLQIVTRLSSMKGDSFGSNSIAAFVPTQQSGICKNREQKLQEE